MNYSPKFIEDTVRIIINNINDDREYLGLQLGRAQGLVSESLYEKERAVYLVRSKFFYTDLVERSKILQKLVGDRLNSEMIKTAFRCSIEEAAAVFEDISEVIISCPMVNICVECIEVAKDCVECQLYYPKAELKKSFEPPPGEFSGCRCHHCPEREGTGECKCCADRREEEKNSE